MEKAFNLLRSQGKNNLEGILKLLKDNKLLDNTTERIAREALSGLTNPNDITLEKFVEVITLIGKEKGADIFKGLKSVIGKLLGPNGQGSSGSNLASDDSDTIHHDDHDHDDHEHDDHDHDDHEHDNHDHDDHEHDDHDNDDHEHDDHEHDEPEHDEPEHDEPEHDEPEHDEPEHDEPEHD